MPLSFLVPRAACTIQQWGQAALLPWDLKGTREWQPALGTERDIGQPAMTTKRSQGSPLWELKVSRATCAALTKQDQKDLSNLPSYRVINCYTVIFSL